MPEDRESRVERYKQAKKLFKERRQKLQDDTKAFFINEIRFFFDEFPWIEKIEWVQGTPSFCDGDPCSFFSTHDDPDINKVHDEEEPERAYKAVSKKDEMLAKSLLKSFMKTFEDDDMKDMFQDPCRVVVTKDKIEIEEYYID